MAVLSSAPDAYWRSRQPGKTARGIQERRPSSLKMKVLPRGDLKVPAEPRYCGWIKGVGDALSTQDLIDSGALGGRSASSSLLREGHRLHKFMALFCTSIRTRYI